MRVVHQVRTGHVVSWAVAVVAVLAWAPELALADDGPATSRGSRAAVRDAVTAVGAGAAPVARKTTYRRRTRWDVAAEGGLSFFEDPSGILGEPLPAGVTPFRWGAHVYDGAFGLRFTVGFRAGLNRWEGRGTYWGSWDDRSRQTGQFGFRPAPGGALALSPAGASASLSNETRAWSGELNWWRTLDCNDCWHISAGLGARYLRIDDEALARNWVGLAPNSFLQGEVENRFLGAQLLGDLRMFASPSFEIGMTLKVLLGAMGRDLQERDTSIVTGGATLNAVREESGFAWGLEGEIGVLYRLTPRLGVRAAYTILVLDQVGRAEDTLDLAQAATGSVQLFDRADIAVLHALFVGLRIDL